MVKSVAVIGAGAAGAVTAAALNSEDYFDTIRVFERRHTAGGTWIYDPEPGHLPLNPGALPPETDPPLDIPKKLPVITEISKQNRFETTPIYEELTTNVPDVAMCFSDLPFAYGPFAPHHVPKQYIENYFSWHKTDLLLSLGTTVEDVSKLEGDRWRLVLRKPDAARQVDRWWEEQFDALIIANGHYSVPYVPTVAGLPEYMRRFPGRVEHSKTYRTPHTYEGQNVLVIGNSASGHDVSQQLLDLKSINKPIYVSRRSRGRWDKDDPDLTWQPIITEYRQDGSIAFVDGSVLKDIDKVIYCTGYKPSYPFWNQKANGRPLFDYTTGRLIQNFQHTFVPDFPTLGFVGLPRVLTFRSFEYQAVALARLWSRRNTLPMPPHSEQINWEQDRADLTERERRKFHDISWDNGETMVWFRWLSEFAGLPRLEGEGRCPPVLNAETRWAIENIKKYPDTRPKRSDSKSERGSQGTVLGRDWVMVKKAEDGCKQSLEAVKDPLGFI